MTHINYKAEGIIFDIQRFSLNDGPGIRTIAFFKGCPLRCLWCSNPESQIQKSVVMFEEEKCVRCGSCEKVCNYGAASLNNPKRIDRTKCVGCGECAGICPVGALVLKGEKITVEHLIRVLKKDEIIYRKSNGGITLSGGEPLVQWKFATELLKACKAQGWHTAIETTGQGTEEAVESVFPFVDQVLLDVKTMDSELHKKVTGVTTDIIRKNAKRITEIAQTIIRIPTIPTINDSDENYIKTIEYAKTLKGVDTIHILPYHMYGENKYTLLDREYPMGFEIKPLSRERAEELKNLVLSRGLKCAIGG